MRKMCLVSLGLSLSLWSIDSHAATYVQIEQRQFLQVVRGVDTLKQEHRLLSKYKEESEKLRAEQMKLIEDMQRSLDFCEQQMKQDGAHLDQYFELLKQRTTENEELQSSRDAWRLTSWAQTAAIVVLVGGWFLLN